MGETAHSITTNRWYSPRAQNVSSLEAEELGTQSRPVDRATSWAALGKEASRLYRVPTLRSPFRNGQIMDAARVTRSPPAQVPTTHSHEGPAVPTALCVHFLQVGEFLASHRRCCGKHPKRARPRCPCGPPPRQNFTFPLTAHLWCSVLFSGCSFFRYGVPA